MLSVTDCKMFLLFSIFYSLIEVVLCAVLDFSQPQWLNVKCPLQNKGRVEFLSLTGWEDIDPFGDWTRRFDGQLRDGV